MNTQLLQDRFPSVVIYVVFYGLTLQCRCLYHRWYSKQGGSGASLSKYWSTALFHQLLHIYWSVVTSIHPKSLLFLFVLDVWSHPNSILLLLLLLLVTIKVTGYHTNQENRPQNEEAGDWNPIRSQMISDWTTIPVQCGYLIKDNDHNTIYTYPRA